MTSQYSGDLRTGVSTELDLLGAQIEQMLRDIRRLKAWKEEVSSGNLIRASNIQGALPAANGGSAVAGSTLGSVDVWNNASGGTQVQGTVVIENGNRTFGTTTAVDDLKVIGVLDDASVAVGVDGRVRHNGYQAVAKVQGVVVAGHYLRSSATAGRAEDAGVTASSASFALALTANGGGAGTVAAYVFDVGGGGGTGGISFNETPAGAIDGVNATFTLAFTPSPTGSLLLYKNGLLQRVGAGNDYTLAGATITFLAGNIPLTGDILLATYWH